MFISIYIALLKLTLNSLFINNINVFQSNQNIKKLRILFIFTCVYKNSNLNKYFIDMLANNSTVHTKTFFFVI